MTTPSEDAVALTRRLVQLDSANPPGDESAVAALLAGMLERAGLTVDQYEFAAGRTSLVASLPGVTDAAPICFAGHIDTVPFGHTEWTVDPLSAEIDRGRLYGRGSSDMKSGIAAMTVAAIGVAAGPRPPVGLRLVICAGEETGCEGARHLAEANALGAPAGAMVVPEPTDNSPVLTHKGALWVRLRARGRTAHGSMPHLGDNAALTLIDGVSRLMALDLAAPAHPVLGAMTRNLGRIQAGQNINSVPDHAEAHIDLRTLPGQDHAAVLAELRAGLGETIEVEPIASLPALGTDPAGAWVARVAETTRAVTNEKPIHAGMTYFTDASVLTPAMGGPPTVVLGPGHASLAHQTDEYCTVTRIEQATEIFTEIAADWCLRRNFC